MSGGGLVNDKRKMVGGAWDQLIGKQTGRTGGSRAGGSERRPLI